MTNFRKVRDEIEKAAGGTLLTKDQHFKVVDQIETIIL